MSLTYCAPLEATPSSNLSSPALLILPPSCADSPQVLTRAECRAFTASPSKPASRRRPRNLHISTPTCRAAAEQDLSHVRPRMRLSRTATQTVRPHHPKEQPARSRTDTLPASVLAHCVTLSKSLVLSRAAPSSLVKLERHIVARINWGLWENAKHSA